MSKRWTISEDIFLADFFDAVGDLCGTVNLGRPAGAATERVKYLKATKAWDALRAMRKADYEHHRAYFRALRNNRAVEELDLLHPFAPEEMA